MKLLSFLFLAIESTVMRAIEKYNCTGLESYQKHTEESQISLGIGGRYLLNVTGNHVGLATLHTILGFSCVGRNFPSRSRYVPAYSGKKNGKR
jgi:hypothetical protein